MCLALSATDFACSADPPRKFPPAMRSMIFRASSMLPVILASIDAASLNLDPSFLRFESNFSTSWSLLYFPFSSLDRSSLRPSSSMYGILEESMRWATLPISPMLRPCPYETSYPPLAFTPKSYIRRARLRVFSCADITLYGLKISTDPRPAASFIPDDPFAIMLKNCPLYGTPRIVPMVSGATWYMFPRNEESPCPNPVYGLIPRRSSSISAALLMVDWFWTRG